MRRFLLAMAALAVLAGCSHNTSSGSSTTTSGSGGENVTVQSSGGTITEGKTAVDASTIGLPVYPGATQSESVSTTHGSAVTLTTNDSFDKVAAWYKSQMPAGSEKVNMTGSSGSMAVFQTVNGNEQRSVTIQGTSASTAITLVSGPKT